MRLPMEQAIGLNRMLPAGVNRVVRRVIDTHLNPTSEFTNMKNVIYTHVQHPIDNVYIVRDLIREKLYGDAYGL